MTSSQLFRGGRRAASRARSANGLGRRRIFSALFRWQGRSVLAMFMVAVAVVGLAATAYAAAPASGPVRAVHVDVIGDSLSTGFKTPGNTWPGQAQGLLAGSGLKAQVTNSSENGAGYVQPGEFGDVFLDLVNRVVNSQSQVVVLFGSDNDTGDAGLAAAVQETLARVKVLAPDATIVVVGPTSESDDQQGQLEPIRQALSQQAAAMGARFVDPVALGWFQGAAATNLSSDLEHPNAAGETYLASHLVAIMTPPVRAAMRVDQLRRSAAARNHTKAATPRRWPQPEPGPVA